MKETIITLCLAATAVNTYAYDEHDATALVKKYSETIACQIDEISEYQENQYKAVMINPGQPDLGGLGAQFVVYWEGDIGCKGGNGTITPNFTLVEHSGFASAAPVVRTDYLFPKIELVQITNFSGGNGKIFIKGLARGPEDSHNFPTKVVSYSLSLIDNMFVTQ